MSEWKKGLKLTLCSSSAFTLFKLSCQVYPSDSPFQLTLQAHSRDSFVASTVGYFRPDVKCWVMVLKGDALVRTSSLDQRGEEVSRYYSSLLNNPLDCAFFCVWHLQWTFLSFSMNDLPWPDPSCIKRNSHFISSSLLLSFLVLVLLYCHQAYMWQFLCKACLRVSIYHLHP